MKIVYFNDTGREISIYPATEVHGTKCDMPTIYPLDERTILPENTYPWVKMWDYRQEHGLSILSPLKVESKKSSFIEAHFTSK
ncbi:hypothetical protein ABC382_22095 [Lysinibacillus sp. 1P01SD]|uniref:hypothetical protein n=1 Tax=Lysinibacillus sp. 1P01SD TaxID=3132285 RepID=UPI00399F5FAA